MELAEDKEKTVFWEDNSSFGAESGMERRETTGYWSKVPLPQDVDLEQSALRPTAMMGSTGWSGVEGVHDYPGICKELTNRIIKSWLKESNNCWTEKNIYSIKNPLENFMIILKVISAFR